VDFGNQASLNVIAQYYLDELTLLEWVRTKMDTIVLLHNDFYI
jgi:hypothetical protein